MASTLSDNTLALLFEEFFSNFSGVTTHFFRLENLLPISRYCNESSSKITILFPFPHRSQSIDGEKTPFRLRTKSPEYKVAPSYTLLFKRNPILRCKADFDPPRRTRRSSPFPSLWRCGAQPRLTQCIRRAKDKAFYAPRVEALQASLSLSFSHATLNCRTSIVRGALNLSPRR